MNRLIPLAVAACLAGCVSMPLPPAGTETKCAQQVAATYADCINSGWSAVAPLVRNHMCADAAEGGFATCPKISN